MTARAKLLIIPPNQGKITLLLFPFQGNPQRLACGTRQALPSRCWPIRAFLPNSSITASLRQSNAAIDILRVSSVTIGTPYYAIINLIVYDTGTIFVLFENRNGFRIRIVVTSHIVTQRNIGIDQVVHDSGVTPINGLFRNVMAPFLHTLTNPVSRKVSVYVFVAISHDRRKILHFAVSSKPHSQWAILQLRETFAFDETTRYVIRDNDAIFSEEFKQHIKRLGLEDTPTAPHSPWQNPICERVNGTLRRECLDHVIILNEKHLRTVLTDYIDNYYNVARTHMSLTRTRPFQDLCSRTAKSSASPSSAASITSTPASPETSDIHGQRAHSLRKHRKITDFKALGFCRTRPKTVSLEISKIIF
jgi:hypothetical protein